MRRHKVILDTALAELYSVSVKRLNEQVKRNRKRFLLRQCFHVASSQNQIGPILNKLQQTDRYPAVDMAGASTELAGLPQCSAETLPPHPHFHLQASRRAGVFSAAGVRIVNGYALLYVTELDG